MISAQSLRSDGKDETRKKVNEKDKYLRNCGLLRDQEHENEKEGEGGHDRRILYLFSRWDRVRDGMTATTTRTEERAEEKKHHDEGGNRTKGRGDDLNLLLKAIIAHLSSSNHNDQMTSLKPTPSGGLQSYLGPGNPRGQVWIAVVQPSKSGSTFQGPSYRLGRRPMPRGRFPITMSSYWYTHTAASLLHYR